MQITPQIKNAFHQKAASGVVLQKIEEGQGETKFTAYVAQLGKSITVGCNGHLTPKQAEAEAGRIAAYLSSLAPREQAHGRG